MKVTTMPTQAPEVTLVFGAKFHKFSEGLKRFESDINRSMSRISKDMKRLGKDFEDAGKRMTAGITAPLIGLGVAATRSTALFDDSLTKINSLVGVNREQIAAWRDDILSLGPAVGKGPAELADAMFFITSAGLRGKGAMDALVASAKGSAIGLGETAVVADAATSAVNAYGEANLSASDSVGILVATVKEGKASADAIAGSLGKVIPVAAELGVEFNEVGAAIAAMTRLGLSADEAATSLKATMTSILKPTQEAREAFKEMGLSVEGLQRQLDQDGLFATLMTIKEATDGNKEAMGRAIPNITALSGVLALVGKNADATNTIFQNLSKAGLADLEEAFEAAQNSPMFVFRQAMASINSSMIILGSELLPKVVPLVKSLTATVVNASRAFSMLSDETKASLLKFAGIAALAGPTLIVVGAIVGSIGSLVGALGFMATSAVKAFRLLSTAAVTAFRGLSIAVGLLATPIGAALAAIGALGIGFKIFGNTIKEATLSAWGVIKEYFEDKWNRVVAGFEYGFYRAKRAWQQFRSIFDDDIEILPEKTLEDFTSKLENFDFEAARKKHIDGVKANARRDWAEFLATIDQFGEDVKAKFKAILPEGFDTILFGNSDDISFDTGEEYFAKLKKQLEGLQTEGRKTGGILKESFMDASDTLKDGIKEGIKGFKTLGDIAGDVLDRLTDKFLDFGIDNLFGSLNKSGGILGGIGKALGFFADGGRPPVGRASIVGERGPELFVPDAAGTVIPNHVAFGGQGAGGISISIDARGSGDPAAVEAAADRAAIRMLPELIRLQEQRRQSGFRPGFA